MIPSSTALLNVLLQLCLWKRGRENRRLCVFIRTINASSLHRARAGGENVRNVFLAGRYAVRIGEIYGRLEKFSIRLDAVGERIMTKNLTCLSQMLGPEH